MNLDPSLKSRKSEGLSPTRTRSVATLLVATVGAALAVLLILWPRYSSIDLVAAAPVVMLAADWRLVKGEGVQRADGLEIQRSDTGGVAVAQGAIRALDARRYHALEWHVDGLRQGQELQLAWSSADNPRLPRYRVLSHAEAGRGSLDLREEPQWRGQIVAIALVIRGAVEEPIRIRRLELRSGSRTPLGLLSAIAHDWSASGGWTGRSINFNKDAEPDGLFSPVPIVALWVGLACLLHAFMNPPWRGYRSVVPYAVILLSGWLALDLLWQKDLFVRLQQSATLYAGLDDRERQLAGPDRSLYPFSSALREHLPGSPARIFILSAEPNGSTVGRIRYHLLPNNASIGSTDLPSAEQARPGDYVLMLPPARRVRYDAEQGLLITGETRLPVERVYAQPSMGELFRVRGGS